MSGILTSGCVFTDGQVIKLEDYPGLRLELELGYKLKREIEPLSNNIIKINNNWFEIVPIIEMPSNSFRLY